MGNIMDILARHLASNILALRRKQGLSQVQLSQKAGIPRSTLTYIESGESNPTLGNLAKVANALQVSVEELISQPQPSTRLVKSNDVPIEKKSKNKITVEKLLPDPIPGMEIDGMSLAPGSRLKGTPHIARTKEHLYCSSGPMNVYVNRTQHQLETGDVLAFPGDEPHAYEKASRSKKATCFSVVVFAPTGI